MATDASLDEVYRIGSAATELLEELRPWTAQPESVRRKCVDLTLALATFSEGGDDADVDA